MSAPVRQRGFLLTLAVEGIAPLITGCADALHNDRAINCFGPAIVERWREWMRGQPPALWSSSLSELAELPPAKARTEVVTAIDRLSPGASAEDRAVAGDYLCAIPRSVQRALVLDPVTGGFTLPSGTSPDSSLSLLALLPLDASPTSGANLTMLLANLRHQTGHGLAPDEAFKLVQQIVEALAAAHALGIVHGDLKPANVLVSGDAIKLAEAGVGVARHAVAHSRVGMVPVEQLSPADQVSLLRGAGTLLYLSPEQKRGDPPDRRHDLHSLGVLWYQLLVCDVTRPLLAGWKTELPGSVRPEQVALIERCIGTMEHRPRDGSALLELMRPAAAPALEQHRVAFREVSPEEIRRERQRKQDLLDGLRNVRYRLRHWREEDQKVRRLSPADPVWCLVAAAVVALGVFVPTRQPILAGLMAMIAAALCLWLRFRWRGNSARFLYQSVSHKADELAENNPDEVLSWGGKEALLNPDLLAEILAVFEEDMRTLAIDSEGENPL